MKQNNTFELSEQFDDYAEQTKPKRKTDDFFPSKQTIRNLLNYAKAMEVMKNKSGMVYYSIIN